MPVTNKSSFWGKLGNTLAYLLFLGNIMAMVALLMTMLAWVVPPSKTTFFSYLGIGFPIILVVNVLFALFWILFRRKKFLLVNVVIFILCWKPISTYFPVHFKTSEVPTDCIKILSYNVRAFSYRKAADAQKDPMFDYIKSMDADIICFQEFMAKPDDQRGNMISLSQVNKIFSEYPYSKYINLGEYHNKSGYGLACYSKFPITRAERLPLMENRYNGCVAFELEINGKKVLLMNNHLVTNGITGEDKELYRQLTTSHDRETLERVSRNMKARLGAAYRSREKDVNFIVDYIGKQQYDALIVCGDFNDTPISYAYAKMKGDLTDAYANTGLGQGITYNANKFWFRIDYIMHSDEFESYNCEVGDKKYSDHYPVTTYLRFK